jgi:glycosyltransferase involved in cell wall biosynthesis
MKKILYLSFLFEPDLSACSFRNSSLSKELSTQLNKDEYQIDLYTSMPNRYNSFVMVAPVFEKHGNLIINRIKIPQHNSGFLDQILSYRKYFFKVLNATRHNQYDLVFVSSGRLFSTYLGYLIAKRNNSKLYLDIRDIFVDTICDVVKSGLIKLFLVPILKNIEDKVFNYATHINLISGGFAEYFKKYKRPNYSYFTNGIDDEFVNIFLENKVHNNKSLSDKHKIIYAGNFGEGQGLHKIIPQAASLLSDKYEFILYGDGGAKSLLMQEIDRLNITNVKVKTPITRNELLSEYLNADILFVHLNDYDAFKKVLPSKLFELAVFNKPIIAGVSGYAKEFIQNEILGSFVFFPCDVNQMVKAVESLNLLENINRSNFVLKFKRSLINEQMSKSIVSYV